MSGKEIHLSVFFVLFCRLIMSYQTQKIKSEYSSVQIEHTFNSKLHILNVGTLGYILLLTSCLKL